MKVFKEMETVVLMNGKQVDAVIKVITENDEDFSIDNLDFENEGKRDQFAVQLERGSIVPTIVKVEITALNETADASVSEVLVKSSDDIARTVEEFKLIQEAMETLVDSVKSKFETLNQVFGA